MNDQIASKTQPWLSQMDSDNSRASGQIRKCEVFLSFCAEDTGNNFTDHLWAALKRKGILTSIDQKEQDTTKAIEESQISVIVVSEKYDDSAQCLDELAKIMDRRRPGAQTVLPVLPVFYHVCPADVRNQTESYKKNLTEVANMIGWTLENQLEAEVIDSIVKTTLNILSHKCLGVADDLVGIQPHIENLKKLLDLHPDAVQVVGLCGVPGIGKTALASVVYHQIFDQFEASCFLDNVSEFSKSDGLTALQEQLLRATLKWKQVEICNVYEGSVWIQRTLENSKTLLVLDNVDELEQIEILAGQRDWFGEGSKIIITTRDEHILKRFGVDKTYQMNFLDGVDSRMLFCRAAFRSDTPKEGYDEKTEKILRYVTGVPLAIKSLGLHLLDRYVSEWDSVLDKLESIPENLIMRVLEQGFDELPDDIANGIFLDIARFLVGDKIGYLKEIPSQHQYYPMFGSRIWIDKSLMTISDQKIHMNDLREILQQETLEEQGQRSRFCFYDDFHRAMETNQDTTSIQALVLNQEDTERVRFDAKSFSKMINLKLIIIRNVDFSGRLEYLSDELVYLFWQKYPFSHLPPYFEPYQLVELIMTESNITQPWEGRKMLPNLRIMSFRGSKFLRQTPDFSGILNLEMLDLEGCTGLLQVDPSLETLTQLTFLNLKNCESLVGSLNISGMSSLKTKHLDGCPIRVNETI